MIYVNKETAAETKYSLACNREFLEWWKWDTPPVGTEKLKIMTLAEEQDLKRVSHPVPNYP